MKTCFKCNSPKPLSDFYAHSGMSDGRLGKCKECCKKFAETHRRTPVVRKRMKLYLKVYSSLPAAVAQRRLYALEHPEVVRAARARWAKKNLEKVAAKNAVDVAVRQGKIVKTPCGVCGKKKVEGHHKDYSKPLEVEWLCKKHHWAADEERRKTEGK